MGRRPVRPKNVLTISILLWSLFTALTGLAPDLFAGRWVGVVTLYCWFGFMVGMGEAANSPNGNKIGFELDWFRKPRHWKQFYDRRIGIGGVITRLDRLDHATLGWRSSFYLSGLLGLFVVLVWEWYVTNS